MSPRQCLQDRKVRPAHLVHLVPRVRLVQLVFKVLLERPEPVVVLELLVCVIIQINFCV
jgi:hypothetical protein